MKKPLLFKFAAIGVLMLLLLVPLSMIHSVIKERKDLQASVLADIARGSSYSQRLAGPVLVVPFEEKVIYIREDATTKAQYRDEVWEQKYVYFLPEIFSLDGKMKTENRARGIYQAHLYHANNQISGHFELPEKFGLDGDSNDYKFSTPYIAMGISDIRGIENALILKVNDDSISMEPGSRLKILGEGVHANLKSLTPGPKRRLYFSLNLILQGTESFSLMPMGKETHVDLASDWPHPSFIGNFAATNRDIQATGFTARWNNSYFSTNMLETFNDCGKQTLCAELEAKNLGVSLFDSVDQYAKSDRAIKYGLLFISLTFAGFFLFELLKKLAIHPVQYGLVGLSLALFFLLLISLSEHIAFALAYAIASGACILLIGVYMSAVLFSKIHGFVFAGLLVALYSVLYALLCAEDYALLMGSIFVFSLLALFMLLTRKVDWSSVGKISEGAELVK